MASTSPKATRTAAQTPVRGRGRGRPRLYARGTSSAARRKIQQASAQKSSDGPSSSRRRPAYSNGYRPGGAGGGGRYIHPSTGEEIPASVYKEIMKSGEKGDLGNSARRTALPPPPPPPTIGPDGVYKPREERSYAEFHPGFDIEQPLHAFTAQEVDGENYKPPVLLEAKTVKIVDIKDEELRKESGLPTRDGSQSGTSIRGSAQPEGSIQCQNTEEYTSGPEKHRSESATSPVSPSPNGMSTGASTASHTDHDPMSMSVNGIGDLPAFSLRMDDPTGGVNGLAIDPALALAALTPPPIPSTESAISVPIDPALAPNSQPAPAQTQTPAATPTDGPLKDDTVALALTPPPVTPAGAESGTPSLKRGVSDVPTLASLRAHRTTAGKPPPRSLPPQTARKPRPQNRDYNHEKLNLRAPSYRKIQPFKFSEVGWNGSVGSKGPRGLNNPQSSNQVEPMSDKMIAVGYQKSTRFRCPETLLRGQLDVGVDEELGSNEVDLVEYDMDEQDDKWLTNYNSHRMITGDDLVSKEIFEFVMTKTEKEWVNLERKMPKVQAKPHGIGLPNRRRSSGRAAEDDEDDGAEDSKCAICDDGECENANAIVFCDGCNLAVHQECYGVPYIPEGQWHCRKCQQIPRQIASCVFCPNTDGAFKQTTTNRWAHLLCAIWIPEVRLANPSFMEPVEGVDLVPKSRWKLNCYICKQRMGACIQCSNRNCFLAFHVTCGRRARLHMKMKNTSGPGAQLESSGLKALCHKHVPTDWRKENDVDAATEDAMEFYANNFTGREWGDSHAAAMARSGLSEDDVIRTVASRGNRRVGDKRKATVEQKTVWKLPSGAPVIPKVLYDVIVASLEHFEISNVRNFASEACKYWTLKREARRGASLVRRLQVQADSNSFTSLEVIRKNYASMGRVQGTKKLERRKDFAGALEHDLVGLIGIVDAVRQREDSKVKEAEVMKTFVDAMYFPELVLMRDVLTQAQNLDCHDVFQRGFTLIRDRLENRLYPSVSAFSADVHSVLQSPPADPQLDFDVQVKGYHPPTLSLPDVPVDKHDVEGIGRKIMHSLQRPLESAEVNERKVWIEMHQRPAKRPRILEGLLTDASWNSNGKDTPNSPSDQLARESSPETSASQLPSGGTILGTVSAKLAQATLVESGDKERPAWYVKDYRPGGADNESRIVANAELPDQGPPTSALTTELEPHSTPSPAKKTNGFMPTLEEMHIKTSTIDEDQDMEDAPGEIDDEFLPSTSPGHLSEGLPEPENLSQLDSDLHDEDAEGELDDELEPQYPITLVPTVINPVLASVSFPDMDSGRDDVGNEDDLLGGYRPEDLPSPLGTIIGDSSSSVGTSTHGTHMLDIPHYLHPTHHLLGSRDPMVDLPDLPPNRIIDGMDLENLTNTSVLSDYPDDLDENGDFDMEIEDVEEASQEATPPGKKGRVTVFKRESNGRFGRANTRRRKS